MVYGENGKIRPVDNKYDGGIIMRRLKKIVTAMLAAAVLISGAAVPMEAQAASTLEKVLYGTAAMVFISRYFSDIDR